MTTSTEKAKYTKHIVRVDSGAQKDVILSFTKYLTVGRVFLKKLISKIIDDLNDNYVCVLYRFENREIPVRYLRNCILSILHVYIKREKTNVNYKMPQKRVLSVIFRLET